MDYVLIKPEDKKPESNMLITQSNRLIEARYTLSLYEQRLVLIMIAMVEPNDEDFKDYIIKISDFSELLELKNKNVYSQIRNILFKLRERTLFIPKGKQDYLITGWISSAEYLGNEGIIKLSFDAKLKPYLLALKSNFTKQKLGEVIKFKGVYTIRIYGLLKQYEKIGTRFFSVDEFRKTLGIKDSQYSLFSDLKRRTILQAKKEFSRKNKNGYFFSDINFDLITKKTGRKISHLEFIIRQQRIEPESPKISKEIIDVICEDKKPLEINQPQQEPENPSISTKIRKITPEIETMRLLGIAENKAFELLNKHGVKYIKDKLDVLGEMQEIQSIKSPSGFLLKAINDDYQSETLVQKSKEKEARKISFQKDQEKKLEDYRHNVTVHFEREIKKTFLSTLSDQQKQEIWLEIKPRLNYIPKSLIEFGKELDSPVVNVELKKYIPQYEERKTNYINLKMAQKRAELFGNIDEF